MTIYRDQPSADEIRESTNVVQVGWVHKDHWNMFAGLTELNVKNVGGRPLQTQSTDWVPIYRIDD